MCGAQPGTPVVMCCTENRFNIINMLQWGFPVFADITMLISVISVETNRATERNLETLRFHITSITLI